MAPDEQLAPVLSVVIVPFVGAKGLMECLKSLAAQVTDHQFEIIIPYDDGHPDIGRLGPDYPEVKFLAVPGRKTYAQLRAAGVLAAAGEIVAVTEDHCMPAPEWCENIILAHRKPEAGDKNPAAIGGPVEKAVPDTIVNWAMYFADYVRYANPVTEGPAVSLTDLNVSYKKTDLEFISGVWKEEFHENEVHAALTANGRVLWLSPMILVLQRREYTFGKAVQDRYAFGRLFASTRVGMVSGGKRALYALFSIFVPVLQFVRIIKHVRNKRKWGGELVKASPALLTLVTVWAGGEFMGYLTGRAGRSLAAG